MRITPPYHFIRHLPPEPFRKYDIRGDTSILTADVVYTLGQCIAARMHTLDESKIIVGRDARLSSPALSQALKCGLLDGGIDVIDLGIVTSPMVYFATNTLNTQCGIALTASHNPKHHNGLKIVLQGKSLTTEDLQALKQSACAANFNANRQGTLENHDIAPAYIEKITQVVQLKKPMKIALDCGNGAASDIAPRVFKALGCEIIPLYCSFDGNFPNHHPDPSTPENLRDLQMAVDTHKTDAGLAFDGDADRLGVVSNMGRIIWPDQQMMLFAQGVLKQHPGCPIVFDVKCSDHLSKVIEAAGGTPIMWKTGHSLIKAHMRSCQAPLAGEMSGHIFFSDPWFGFDDGIYAGVKLLDYLQQSAHNDLDSMLDSLPKSHSTPEIKLPCADHEKAVVMQRLANALPPQAIVNDIDGLRLSFMNGWWLIRASNTTPHLTTRCEGNSPSSLLALQSQLIEWLNQVCPNLDTSPLKQQLH